MTDSDSDITDFPFQNPNMTVRAKGPNTNITNLSFQSRMTSSSMFMPRNMKPPSYDSMCDQRSLYYRRETSPMSVYSACDARQRNYQQFNRMHSQRNNMFNGRSVSPTMSLRSIDSTASLSAADIAFAFKNAQFNKCDLKIIKDAYQTFMKQRKMHRYGRIEKRRRFLKRRRRSGADSADQESNSSLSSDDCRSVKTSRTMSSTRMGREHMADFSRSVKSSTMLKDCSESFRQNNFKHMFSVDNDTLNDCRNSSKNISMSQQPKQNLTQKDRFQNRLLLPSQRFNRSVASSVILEGREASDASRPHKNLPPIKNMISKSVKNTGIQRNDMHNSFSESHRRPLEIEENSLPDNKRVRISSPAKKSQKPVKTTEVVNNNCELSNNNGLTFEFIKPSLPVRKSKSKVQERLISKSAPQIVDLIQPPPTNDENADVLPSTDMPEETSENLSQTTQTSIQNDSTRPSFIKRKLFTQKLDVADKATSGSDCNSPQQSVYSGIQKEKNKSRKLVTNQSCLNREVNDDSNLLDLIHKIVPPDQINITTQSINHTKHVSKKSKENDDKWDVTSVLSMCNEEDGSDTYTDEDIFEGKKNTLKIKKKPEETKVDQVKPKEVIANKVTNTVNQVTPCKIVLKPLSNKNSLQTVHNTNNTQNTTTKVIPFWDTDTTDDECPSATQKIKEKLIKDIIPVKDVPKNIGTSKYTTNKYLQRNEAATKEANKTIVNNTLDSMRSFNLKTLTVRSHRDTKRKKRVNDSMSDTIHKENIDISTMLKTKITSKKLTDTNIKNMANNLDTNQQSKASNLKSKIASKSTKINSCNEENNDPEVSKSNLDLQNKKPCEPSKSKTTKNNPTKLKTPRSKDVNVTKGKPIKTIEKNLKSESKSVKQDKANEPNSKSETQKSKNNIKVDKSNEKTKASSKYQSKTNKLSPNSKNTKAKSLISKTTPNRANNSRLKTIKDIALVNSNITLNISRNDRLIRSCRTPKLIQNESIDYSLNSDLNVSCEYKNLRSRIINLSSSIENITFNIKPKKRNK